MTVVWNVTRVDRVVDGDTVHLTRSRVVGEVDGLVLSVTDARPVPARLVHLDTPERGETGWSKARDDLIWWVTDHWPLVAYDAGRDNFGRRLVDLKTLDGESASLHMVRDRGWPVWHKP